MAKMALMATIFFLILVNFFVAFARQHQKGWFRIFLFCIALLTLIVAILFGIRALST
jgi:t-SNARE complex subunit (syntaxin)